MNYIPPFLANLLSRTYFYNHTYIYEERETASHWVLTCGTLEQLLLLEGLQNSIGWNVNGKHTNYAQSIWRSKLTSRKKGWGHKCDSQLRPYCPPTLHWGEVLLHVSVEDLESLKVCSPVTSSRKSEDPTVKDLVYAWRSLILYL